MGKSLASVWGELKRRNVVRVAIAYAIVAWLILQVGETLAPALRLADWVCPGPGPIPAVYFQLAEDPEFRAILMMRRIMMWATAQDQENARLEADEMLAMIKARLEEIGT